MTYVEINAVLCCISTKKSDFFSNVPMRACTALSRILKMIPGYNRDVTDVIKGNVLFFIKTADLFLSLFIHIALLDPCRWSLYCNLLFEINERKTAPYDYHDTLGVGHREPACVWCELLLWDIILLPVSHCVFCWVRNCSNAKLCRPGHCDGKLLWHICLSSSFICKKKIFHMLASIILETFTVKLCILKLEEFASQRHRTGLTLSSVLYLGCPAWPQSKHTWMFSFVNDDEIVFVEQLFKHIRS